MNHNTLATIDRPVEALKPLRLEAHAPRVISSAEPTDIAQPIAVVYAGNPKYKQEAGKRVIDEDASCTFDIIDMRHAEVSVDGGKLYGDERWSEDAHYLIMQKSVHNADGRRGYKVLRAGESVVIGRGQEEMVRRFEMPGDVSRAHLELRVNDEGILEVVDLASSNGTFVAAEQPADVAPMVGNDYYQEPARRAGGIGAQALHNMVNIPRSVIEEAQRAVLFAPVDGNAREIDLNDHAEGILAEINKMRLEDPEREVPRYAQNIIRNLEVRSAAKNRESDAVVFFERAGGRAGIYARMERAKQVAPDELVRTPGNGGRALDEQYVRNHEKVQELFIDEFVVGNLYASPDDFVTYIKQAHRLAAAGNVYDRVGEGNLLGASGIGEFRTGGMSNGRVAQAEAVAEIARKYNDPYAERFTAEDAGVHSGSLPGIDQDNQVIDYGRGEGYRFKYPPARAIGQYMAQMAKLGGEIHAELQQEYPDINRAVELIAKQYQYGATIRPFAQINNSLFMDLANAQLKMFDLKGMTHGEMDLAAQRMQPDAFVQHFKDRHSGIAE